MKTLDHNQMANVSASGLCGWFGAGIGIASCFLAVLGPFSAGIGVGCMLNTLSLDRESGLNL